MSKQILKALGAETTAGQGSTISIGNADQVEVTVRVTAGSGTVTTFRVYLEESNDGTNWFEVAMDLVMKGGLAAPGAATPNQRDIVNETAVQTSAKYVGKAMGMAPAIRAAWAIAGTTPSETFEVLAEAK